MRCQNFENIEPKWSPRYSFECAGFTENWTWRKNGLKFLRGSFQVCNFSAYFVTPLDNIQSCATFHGWWIFSSFVSPPTTWEARKVCAFSAHFFPLHVCWGKKIVLQKFVRFTLPTKCKKKLRLQIELLSSSWQWLPKSDQLIEMQISLSVTIKFCGKTSTLYPEFRLYLNSHLIFRNKRYTNR